MVYGVNIFSLSQYIISLEILLIIFFKFSLSAENSVGWVVNDLHAETRSDPTYDTYLKSYPVM